MPISVSCPACGKEYNVKDEAAGKKFKCKECEAIVEVPAGGFPGGGAFTPPTAEPENPFADLDIGGPALPAAPRPATRSSSRSSGGRSAALGRVSGPAVGLMVTAGIGMLGAVGFGLLFVIAAVAGPPPGQNMKPAEMMVGFGFWIVLFFFQFIMSCLVMFGAFKMKKCESYGLAMAASIVAAIPCLTPCLCMPFGIWGIVALNDSDVKAAFR